MITLLVIYASWYPLSGWRDNGMVPWAYLNDAMPRYWTWFDLIVNILGYIPLGVLSVLALYPFLRGFKAVALSTVAGILLAMLMEAVQTYLPSRVPSNLDLLTNSIGVFWVACVVNSCACNYLNIVAYVLCDMPGSLIRQVVA